MWFQAADATVASQAARVARRDRRSTAMTEHYDAIVIGGGQAGPFLAARLAGAGQQVALIERR